jgi:hypothetical protein
MDVSNNQDRENQNVIMFKSRKTVNQEWDIIYVDQLQPEPKEGDWNPQFGMYIGKEFSITTKMSSGRYVDLVGDQLVIKSRTASKTQKWIFDWKSRTVLNVANKKSLSISSSGRGNKMNTWKTTSEWFQMYRYHKFQIINIRDKVMSVNGAKDVEGREIEVNKNSRGTHQQWNIVYTDKEVEIKDKGVSDWGFHIGRPFYIVTQMASGRAIELSGGRNLLLRWKKWNEKS